MNFATLAAALVFATALTVVAATSQGPAPAGWTVAGSQPAAYQVGTVPQGGENRGPAGFIRSKQDDVKGFGTLMQTIDAADYRGKRVRFSGVVRTEEVRDWSGLWMRVDGATQSDTGRRKVLAFDNMQQRSIKGTTGWVRHDVVLDVPMDAVAVAFGILVSGTGAAYLDGVKLEVVPDSVPTTGTSTSLPDHPRQPRNLGFSN